MRYVVISINEFLTDRHDADSVKEVAEDWIPFDDLETHQKLEAAEIGDEVRLPFWGNVTCFVLKDL